MIWQFRQSQNCMVQRELDVLELFGVYLKMVEWKMSKSNYVRYKDQAGKLQGSSK